MNVNIDRVLALLSTVTDPHTFKKLSLSATSCEVIERDGQLEISLKLPYTAYDIKGELRQRIAQALQSDGLTLGRLHLQPHITSHAVQEGQRPLPNVRNIIAVASGKGGVGKSTTSVNLALALHMQGARVGLLDADIYGPSVPIMLGLSGKPKALEGNMMEPLVGHGLQANSIGFIIEENAPAIWRGPMVTQALTQLLTQTLWNNLDYLIIDMPPGTGDIALTLAQKVPVTAAVIVTTPQDLALADAKRGLAMFQKVNIPVLGIVENMSVHICSQCGHEEAIFGQHGGRDMAAEYNVPWLGALPLAMSIRSQTDSGNPTVIAAPDSAEARLYQEIATRVSANISVLPPDTSGQRPKVVPRPL
ncbi:iron-sulfur cluster carrier protein ApbC [Alcaligenes endophyticus]|uniref:Iron-sulfur cluster carrier protein n=1 Tax=Alcaligenes endophyticus TaxID=1929088 RepID=A0ABT8EGL8_9BURK|nr:iron-sulfur cluster carrier protein ApbC [Alcaligenes endophyticus]MCX5589904.1 iron-sulfur cluster carrier protein ApbC [Alcaligenes endophyticus]MDN4120433.1 iron-sulfur cluster carrier protein ApbC [Alcaligenes endophyticus]